MAIKWMKEPITNHDTGIRCADCFLDLKEGQYIIAKIIGKETVASVCLDCFVKVIMPKLHIYEIKGGRPHL